MADGGHCWGIVVASAGGLGFMFAPMSNTRRVVNQGYSKSKTLSLPVPLSKDPSTGRRSAAPGRERQRVAPVTGLLLTIANGLLTLVPFLGVRELTTAACSLEAVTDESCRLKTIDTRQL